MYSYVKFTIKYYVVIWYRAHQIFLKMKNLEYKIKTLWATRSLTKTYHLLRPVIINVPYFNRACCNIMDIWWQNTFIRFRISRPAIQQISNRKLHKGNIASFLEYLEYFQGRVSLDINLGPQQLHVWLLATAMVTASIVKPKFCD